MLKKPDKNLDLSRYEFARSVISERRAQLPSRTLYDIGSGDERMRRLEELDLDWNGFDLNPQRDAMRWDLSEPNSFDLPKAGVVIMLDVIEHCSNPAFALSNVANAMEDGAILIATVPNPKWSRARMALLVDGYLTCFTESDLVDNHHVFTPWPHILGKLLGDAKFEVLEYVTLDGWTRPYRRPMSLTYPFRVAVAAILRMIELRDPSACGMSFGVVARRQPRGCF
jgi:SAM-dependent methyltransferase